MQACFYLCESTLFQEGLLKKLFGSEIPDWILSQSVIPELGVWTHKGSYSCRPSTYFKGLFPDRFRESIFSFLETGLCINEQFSFDLCYPAHPFWNIYTKKMQGKEGFTHLKSYKRHANAAAFFSKQNTILFSYQGCVVGVSTYLSKVDTLYVEELNLFTPFIKWKKELREIFRNLAERRSQPGQSFQMPYLISKAIC